MNALIKNGANEIFVQVEKENAKGIRFYDRNGFQQVREFPLEFPEQNLKMIEYAQPLKATPNNELQRIWPSA
jgi:ribosomal protein S18 acetylase RimI-like enzyme